MRGDLATFKPRSPARFRAAVQSLLGGPTLAETVWMDSASSTISLPPSWPDHAKAAFLQAPGMAHMAMAHIRGRCAGSPVAEVSLNADNDRFRSELELLREELRIKDARMARLPARHRPRYSRTPRKPIWD
jgi:hypothetical protein